MKDTKQALLRAAIVNYWISNQARQAVQLALVKSTELPFQYWNKKYMTDAYRYCEQ
jgi:hypothetical protein